MKISHLEVRPRLVGLVVGTMSCLVACSVGVPGGPTEPALPEAVPRAQAPWMVFQADGPGRTEIDLIRADGTDRHAVAGGLGDGDQTNPDWDPSGTRLTFAMSDGSTDDLWVTGIEGTQPRRLVDCVAPCRYLDDPAWSPSGRAIVFSRTVDRHGTGVSTLETVDVSTGATRVLLGPFTRWFTAGARWSPDGRRIVFEMVRKADAGVDAEVVGVTLMRTTRSGLGMVALTDPDLFAATADWSPDGRLIVYAALGTAEDTTTDLFVVRPRGGGPRRITDVVARGGSAAEPAWSPDGRSIVFSGRLDSPGESLLLSVGLDGGTPTPAIGDDLVHGRHPRWQPTG